MIEESNKNKQIIKNSFLLYVRFFLTMIVSLFTSRIILQNLGVVNFGLYNVISGVITIFAMLNLSLSSQRFISFELGRKDIQKLNRVITNFNTLNVIICVTIFLCAETVGVWFLNEKMEIPIDRKFASNIAYQCTIASFLSLIYSTTYVSCVISYERMSAFAFISIIEVVGKLIIALLLPLFVGIDPLILYSVLLMIVQVAINLSYLLYCKIKINVPLKLEFNKNVLREIMGFSMLLNITGIFVWLSQQGLNVLLNIFCGPVVNAARGIGMQVMSAVENFSCSFLKAAAPQITKTYASKDFIRLNQLFVFSSKYSFLLIAFISLPIFFYADYVLKLWLGNNVPHYTSIFVRLTLCWVSLSILSQPCMYVVQASGNVKWYQFLDIVGCGAIFFLSYCLLKFNVVCWCVYVVSIIFELILFFIRLKLVSIRTDLLLITYFSKVVLKILLIIVPICLALYVFTQLCAGNIINLILLFVIEFFMMTLLVYTTGSLNEKILIKNIIKNGKNKSSVLFTK